MGPQRPAAHLAVRSAAHFPLRVPAALLVLAVEREQELLAHQPLVPAALSLDSCLRHPRAVLFRRSTAAPAAAEPVRLLKA